MSHKRFFYAFAVLAPTLLLITGLLAPVFAARPVIMVSNSDDSGPGSLRDAIANASSGDTIVFEDALEGSTILLTSDQLTIDKDLTIVGLGASELLIRGLGPAVGPSHRIFEVLPGRTVTISKVKIAFGAVGMADGGGILNAGTLNLSDVIVWGNEVEKGGSGAGIYNEGTLDLRDCLVNANVAGLNGQDIVVNNGTMGIRNSIFRNNDGDGAIIDNRTSGNLSVVNSAIIYNGVLLDGVSNRGTLSLANSTISSNGGSGISNSGLASLNNNTISDNGVGVSVGYPLNMILTNNIIANNMEMDCSDDLNLIISGGYNLDGDDSCNLTATGDITGTNPLLTPLGLYGGKTIVQALMPGSPAIDAGNPAFPNSTEFACELKDQRGISRPADQDGDGIARCDIGAFEVNFVSYMPAILAND